MLSEYIRKPIFFLPGSGGAADLLWDEFFKKNYQLQYFSPKQIEQLRGTPYINSPDPNYGSRVYDLVSMVQDTVSRQARKEVLAMDKITLPEFVRSMKRLSLEVWGVAVVPILLMLFSIGYSLGRSHAFGRFREFLGL
jgi:hypothetical protein